MSAESKFFEIRDRATNISVVATRITPENMTPDELFVWERAGWRGTQAAVFVTRLNGGETKYSPNAWGNDTRTMPVAHSVIEGSWEYLTSGQVIDVRYVLKETDEPCKSDRFYGVEND